MPQFDFSTFPSQIFWLVLCFAALYLMMQFVIVPGIGSVVEGRSEGIKADFEAARLSQAEAEQLKNNLKVTRGDARSQARGLINEAEKVIKAEQQKAYDTMARDIKRLMADAEKQISEAKAKALQDIAGVSSELAVMISDSVASVKASHEKAAEMVNQAIKEAA